MKRFERSFAVSLYGKMYNAVGEFILNGTEYLAVEDPDNGHILHIDMNRNGSSNHCYVEGLLCSK